MEELTQKAMGLAEVIRAVRLGSGMLEVSQVDLREEQVLTVVMKRSSKFGCDMLLVRSLFAVRL